jgi:hypothetical protein
MIPYYSKNGKKHPNRKSIPSKRLRILCNHVIARRQKVFFVFRAKYELSDHMPLLGQ